MLRDAWNERPPFWRAVAEAVVFLVFMGALIGLALVVAPLVDAL